MNNLIDGHYALKDANGIPKFYRLTHGTNQWKNYIFIQYQAGDEYFDIKNPTIVKNLINIFKLNPLASMALYGAEIGKCAICSRTLTDDLSIKRGIGLICWNKLNK